jgi:hypothetical protein
MLPEAEAIDRDRTEKPFTYLGQFNVLYSLEGWLMAGTGRWREHVDAWWHPVGTRIGLD